MRSLSHMPMRINNAHRHVVARDSKGLTPEVAVSFMQYGAAFFDHQTRRLESAARPFDARVLPMCPERTLWLCRVGAPLTVLAPSVARRAPWAADVVADTLYLE